MTGLIIAAVAYIVTWDREKRIWSNELEREVLENTLILGGKLAVVERELQGVLALYNSSNYVSRQEFNTYVKPILKTHSYIQSLNWVPRVPHLERKDYEEKMVVEGYPDFRITEWGDQGILVEAQQREEYFPVYYVEPFIVNDYSLGFDLASIPSLRQILNEARDTGRVMATEKIAYFKDNPAQEGIFVFAPFYESRRVPNNLEERRKELEGFVVGYYRIEDMMNQMVKPYQAKGLNLTIFDGDVVTDKTLYGETLPWARREINNLIHFSGRNWLLMWQGNDVFQNGPQKAVAGWIGGGVLTFAFFIAIITEMMASRTRQVETEVRFRTEELTRANDRLTSEVKARSEAERALQGAKEEAELANKAKSAFLANMSHEIRTPMNAMLGYAQILKRNKQLDTGQKTNLENILRSGDHLLNLINDILDISKIEAGKDGIEPGGFRPDRADPGDLLDDPAALRREKHPMAGQRAERALFVGERGRDQTQAGADQPAGQFGQVRGIGEGRPQDHAPQRGDLPVRGDGHGQGHPQGKSEAHLRTVPAGQGRVQKRRDRAGAGDRQKTDRPDGRGAEPRFGTGPGNAVRLHAASAGSQKRTRPLFRRRNQIPAALPEKTRVVALVTDDNEQNRDILANILGERGHRRPACGKRQGRGGADAQTPSGHHLHGSAHAGHDRDGSDEAHPAKNSIKDAIKIVAISASAFSHQRAETLAAGFDDFISKPFHVESIFDCITALMGVDFIEEAPESPPHPNRRWNPARSGCPATCCNSSSRRRIFPT